MNLLNVFPGALNFLDVQFKAILNDDDQVIMEHILHMAPFTSSSIHSSLTTL